MRLCQLGDISGAVHWPAVLEEIVPGAFGDAAQLVAGEFAAACLVS